MLDTRLRHAVAVARCGSFSRAAEAVGMTQSAVTKSVAGLEQRIGYQLFHRTPRGAILTEAGREFVDRAAVLLADAQDLVSGARTDPFSGVLRIGVFPGSLDWVLLDPLAALARKHPAVRFDTVFGASERGVQLLSRGEIDIAIGMEPAFAPWDQVQCAPAGVLETIPFVRRGHPLLDLPGLSLEELAAYAFVSPSSSEPYSSMIRDIYESRGLNASEHIHFVDYFPLVKRLVAATDAVGGVARSKATRPAFLERFAVLENLPVFDPIMVCCAVRKHAPPKAGASALIRLMRQIERH